MKRLLCLLLVLCLALTGCGKKTAEVPATAPATEAPTTAPTTEATEPPTTEATVPPTEEPKPTEPPAPMNPLTGEILEEEYTGRPVAFSLNNISDCLPQYGLQHLDWMFEVETEGGITRCVGIMTDPIKADAVGPIRSCRTYFLNISVSYNAPLFHCGGSIYADSNQYSISESLDSWDHVNEKADGYYFYRDEYRYDYLDYDWEHTLFTSGEQMVEAMEDYGYNPAGNEPVSYGYQFSQDPSLEGEAAESVQIRFRGDKTTTMEYDAASGLYLAHQYGEDWIDGETEENASFRNVLVILAEQSNKLTKRGNHSFYAMDGSGDGYFAVDGKMIPVKWFHEGVEGPFRFTLEDGTTPITLGVGKTYCAIIDVTGSVTAE